MDCHGLRPRNYGTLPRPATSMTGLNLCKPTLTPLFGILRQGARVHLQGRVGARVHHDVV